MSSNIVLNVQNLQVRYETPHQNFIAVDDVSFNIHAGETLAVVGASGSGKSTMAYALLRLVNDPGRITQGRVLLDRRDLLTLPEKSLSFLRGKEIAIITQNPMSSFHPLLKVGFQFIETLRIHLPVSRRAAFRLAVDSLAQTGIHHPEEMMHKFPHQLSGGMLQRLMIAIALCLKPRVLIADESTTALDVTVQAQVLSRLQDLQSRTGAAIVLITHDLAVAAQLSNNIAVMHNGQIIEQQSAIQLFENPVHPYTRELLHAARQSLAKSEWSVSAT